MATELNDESLANAKRIIADNKLEEKIILRKSEGTIFSEIIGLDEEFHFTMCNPPFFDDLEKERKIVKWRVSNLTLAEGQFSKDDRKDLMEKGKIINKNINRKSILINIK